MSEEHTDTNHLARNTDPHTSHVAAEMSEEFASKHRRMIADCLYKYGPLGKDGIAKLLNLDSVQISRRLPELYKSGSIVLTGKIVNSKSNRPEREWDFNYDDDVTKELNKIRMNKIEQAIALLRANGYVVTKNI